MREDDERERGSNESGISMAVDHNWSRREERSCVQKVGDVSALYYPEKETGDSTRTAQRVVAIEDLWDTLVEYTASSVIGDSREWRNT